MSRNIVIVDYNLGNIFSVQQAFLSLGENPILSNDPAQIESADALVLPGVGSFSDAMKNIHELGIYDSIINFIASGKPFLGVCLGMQLLFEESEEFGITKGFGVIKGRIKKFSATSNVGTLVRIPQIGWNEIYPANEDEWGKSALRSIKYNEFMYFVHSFYAEPNCAEDILTLTTYEGIEYCSAVKKDNVFAMQFHPEKSGKEGVRIYKNWIEEI